MLTIRWMRTFPASAALAAILLTGAQGDAQVISWTAPGGGAYRDGANWDAGGGIPGTGNDVFFGLDAIYTVTFSQDEMNNRATVRRGEVTFDLNSYTYSLLYAYSPPASLVLGDATDTDMKLTVLDGRLNIGRAQMATAGASGGTLEIGQDAIVGNGGTMYVGVEGEAELRIIDGGKLLKRSNMFTGATLGENSGSLGVVTVQGAGSDWQSAGSVIVGQFGAGSVSISGGATATNYGSSVRLATGAGSSGAMTIDGAGSALTMAARPASSVGPGDLEVGGEGLGTLTVSGGASFSGAKELHIGYRSSAGDGTLTVTGNGSALSTSNIACIGERGNGVLQVLDGATVSHGSWGFMGIYAGSTGEATVSGPGSIWTIAGRLHMGLDWSDNPGGHATLTVTNGGRVEVDDLMLGPDTVVTADSLTVGTPAAMALGVAPGDAMAGDPAGLFVETLTLADGAQVNAGSLYLNPGGQIHGSGDISGDVVNDGTISPGDSFVYGQATPAIGLLDVAGNYLQAAGSALQMDLGAGATCDLLQATGSAQLDGLLELRLFGGYTPMAGDHFTILTAAGGVDGEFADVTCTALDGTELFADVVYFDTAVDVRILPEPAGCLLLLGAFIPVLSRRRRRRA